MTVDKANPWEYKHSRMFQDRELNVQYLFLSKMLAICVQRGMQKGNPDPTGLINTLRRWLGISIQKEKTKDGSAKSSQCAEIKWELPEVKLS